MRETFFCSQLVGDLVADLHFNQVDLMEFGLKSGTHATKYESICVGNF